MNEEQEQELQQAEKQYQADKAEAIKAIKKYTDSDSEDVANEVGEISWKTILGGDILQSKFVLKQVGLFMFIVLLMLLYTGNRYSSQQDTLLIDSLKQELQDQKYNVLTLEGELLNLSRQSKIEDALKAQGDSLITNPAAPPFALGQDEDEGE